MAVELVVFDWSGTLMDDRKPVYETLAGLLKDHGKEIPPFDEWVSFISNSSTIDALSDFFFKQHGISHTDKELKGMWTKKYGETINNGINSVSYPDSFEILKYLADKGKKIAVVSLQPEIYIMKEANGHGLDKFITRVIGNAFGKEIHLDYLCKEMGVKPENALFVGDMVHDIQAAKKAGIPSVGITTGYHSKDILLAEKPDYVISSLSELKAII